jgi:hypothetical protein
MPILRELARSLRIAGHGGASVSALIEGPPRSRLLTQLKRFRLFIRRTGVRFRKFCDRFVRFYRTDLKLVDEQRPRRGRDARLKSLVRGIGVSYQRRYRFLSNRAGASGYFARVRRHIR